MELFGTHSSAQLMQLAKDLFAEERQEKKVLNGWFLSREIAADASEGRSLALEEKAAVELEAVIDRLPLEISPNAIFAATQRDAFAASYALINPAFEVESFKGYCDPLEVYDYATPAGDVTRERIARMRERAAGNDYVRDLAGVYDGCKEYTGEVAYFVEQVTGHLIPDFRRALRDGVGAMLAEIDEKLPSLDARHAENLRSMRRALSCVLRLAKRYAALARTLAEKAEGAERERYELIERTLARVP